MKRILNHPLFSGSFLMIAGSMGVNVFNYIYHLVMGRMLGPEQYGVLASLFSILYIISIIPLSSSFAIVKFISSAANHNEQQKIYWAIRKLFWNVAAISSVLYLFLTPFISKFLHIPNYFAIISVAGVLFFSLITLVNQATMQGTLNFMGVVGPNFVSSFSKLILGILFLFLGWGVDGAIFGVVLGVAFAYVYSLRFIRQKFKPVISHFDTTEFVRYAFPVLLQALAFTSIFTTDLILAKHYLPSFEAGLYAALSTLGKIIYFAVSPVASVMFPVISGKKTKGEAYRSIFYAAFVITVFISGSIVVCYGLFPKLAIGLLYGEKYLLASKELVWMGIFISLYTVAQLIVNFLLSLGKTHIVVLPVVAGIIQILAIWQNHNSILSIIIVSLITTFGLVCSLFGYLGYNELKNIYVKKR
jgi:O-antigen/teichoic acid export membrane protein